MATNEKGLDRGGTLGQEGDLDTSLEQKRLDRDREKQRGGLEKEPNLEKEPDLEKKQRKQPTHVVD